MLIIWKCKEAIANHIANTFTEVIDMNNDTKLYSSKDVAKRLSLQPVTVRKYSLMLEEQGYFFDKDEKGWRQYSEEHIASLEYLCKMKSMGKSLEESALHIATLYRSNLSLSKPAISLQEKNPLVELIKAQQEFNQKILDRLETLEKNQIEREQNLLNAIQNTQEEQKQSERDQGLLHAIRDTQEVKKLIVTQHKKWWKLW